MMFLILIVLGIQWMYTKVRDRHIAEKYGWKAYKKSFETFIYLERFGEKWREIEISRTYRHRRGDFYLGFKSSKDWEDYPVWAQDREEIIKRMIYIFPNHKPSENEIDDIGKR